MRFVIGTSGWQYDDWRGTFYPVDLPPRAWLEFYTTRFPTVEVNSTFYRLPDRDVFSRWARRVPDGFCFALKASRYLSHVKRLEDPAEPVERFVSRAEGMDRVWGPTLVQLPPTLRLDASRLRGLLEQWPATHRLAIEFRHDSWFTDEVHDLLRDHGAALVLADRRGRHLQPLWRTAPWTYVRFHQGTRSHPSYRTATLVGWIEELRARWTDDEVAYVYFNNDQRGAAVRDAARFARLSGTELTGWSQSPAERRQLVSPRLGAGSCSGERGREEQAMPRAWSEKRERQYEHIKEGVLERGETEDTAEEIAARTVNKERARAGEAKKVSRSSVDDISSGRRGGLRSHSGPGGRTRDQLYNEARAKGIKGRSKMNKAELEKAVGR